MSPEDAPFRVGDVIRCIDGFFCGEEPTCIAVDDTEATFDLDWGPMPFSYWRRSFWEQIACGIPAKVSP